MPALSGKLVHPDAKGWNGYRVTAGWTTPATDDEPSAARFRSAAASATGEFSLDLPEPERVEGQIDLAVNAPGGQLVYGERRDADDDDEEVELNVTTYVEPVVADAEMPPNAVRASRLSGRAVARNGQPARAGEAVVLWGVTAGASDADAWPFLVATIQPAGYFSGERPGKTFSRAYGTVGSSAAIPVALSHGQIPDKIVLVGDVPTGTVADPECECEALSPPRLASHEDLTSNPELFSADLGGHCVDLTVPNRALEEVTWHAVVRISEPTIRAFTLEEERPLPNVLLDGLVKIAAPLTRISADTAGMPREGRRRTRERSGATTPAEAEAPALAAKSLVLDALQARRILRVGETLNTTSVLEADRASRFTQIRELLRRKKRAPFRPLLDGKNRVDWDETPTMNQATSVAHGHVLTFRQTWHADGYSLGDLLYSLPLAPGQKKQIATVDWNRRDAVLRLSDREMRETLSASIERDRDIEEIVRGALDEHVRAGSRATRSAVGGGIGVAIGPIVLGGGGGSAWASSSAWQNSSRDVSGQSLQQIRDRTVQSASASRSQRSTVVQAVQQGESVRAETTTVSNYNHCHAMTIQYFEVLRHFQLTHDVVGVSECLYIPFLLSGFDLEKALRWREPLEMSLRRRDLRAGFDAAERVRTNWNDAHVPVGAYADDPVEWLDGEFTIRVDLPRPKDKDDDTFEGANWGAYEHLLTRDPEEEWRLWLGVVTAAERDRVWATRIAPRIARRLLDKLSMSVVRPDQSADPVEIDATLVSTWRPGRPQLLTVRPKRSLPPLTRRDITGVIFSSGVAVPSAATVMFERGTMRYRTAYLHHDLFTDRLIQNDLGTSDQVEIAVRLDRLEKRRPRDDDRRRAASLLDHLNAHLEYYHRSIWLRMHPNRRYLLLDGFEAPNAGGRSVASVVENRLIGVVGNCLVMPVAPGVHLDPTTHIPPEARGDLLAYYATDSPRPSG